MLPYNVRYNIFVGTGVPDCPFRYKCYFMTKDYSSTTSWSPFPDKGRLNMTRFVVLFIFICLYTIINKSFEAQSIPTSLPLSWEHSASLRIKFAVGKH